MGYLIGLGYEHYKAITNKAVLLYGNGLMPKEKLEEIRQDVYNEMTLTSHLGGRYEDGYINRKIKFGRLIEKLNRIGQKEWDW